LISLPPSPTFFSILQINVPSGIASNAKMFRAVDAALAPISILLPTVAPSTAGIYE
jgi:hypothetical protein